MSTFDTAGVRARDKTDASHRNNSGDCAFCERRASGVDAATGLPACRDCGDRLNASGKETRLVAGGEA